MAPHTKKEILLRYKPGGVQAPGEAGERRRQETAAAASHRREETLRAKRLRRDTSLQGLALSQGASRASLGASEPTPEASEEEGLGLGEQELVDIGAEVTAAVAAAAAAHPVGSRAHVEAIRSLRQLLSAFDEPPWKEAVDAGAVPLLIAALQPPRMDDTALEGVLEAAWALTNLAAGGAAAVHAVLPAAPVLIAYLSGDSGAPLAEQCAWALGNLAGEDADFRRTLVANGALRPLLGLIQRAARLLPGPGAGPTAAGAPGEDHPALSAATTGAWALSNLLREAGPEVGEVVGVEGAVEALLRLLGSAPRRLATEAAWVLAYLSAASDTYVQRLVALGVLPPLLRRLTAEVEQLAQDAPEGRAFLVPALRTLGNVSAAGGDAALRALLAPDAAPAVLAVVGAAQSEHHGLQREAASVLGNLAGAPGRAGIDAVKAAGAIPVLLSLLKECPFHVRKEAAAALANVAAGGGGSSGDAEALTWLFAGDRDALRAMLSLMRSADMDAARLGVQFTEMFLRLIDRGPELVESVDGIDALEAVQFGAAPAELQRMAADLVNRYYGTGEEGMSVEEEGGGGAAGDGGAPLEM